VNCQLVTFYEIAGIKLPNKYISFQEYFEKLDNSAEKPKFYGSAHICCKTNSMARLTISWVV